MSTLIAVGAGAGDQADCRRDVLDRRLTSSDPDGPRRGSRLAYGQDPDNTTLELIELR